MFSREGKNPTMTCGIVSPTIMQNAIMPPKALRKKLAMERIVKKVSGPYNAH